MLYFEHDKGRWLWNLDRIRAKGNTDNVVDLMVGKLSRLPIATQQALQLLACIGSGADVATLAIVMETSEHEAHVLLWDALRQELAVRLDSEYKFVHDRVQEAAYSLIPEQLRAEAHVRIGRLLRAHIPPDKREEAIFEIVGQFNRGAALIASLDEREQLAELYLVAGRRAKASAAYASALNYLAAGAALLPEDFMGTPARAYVQSGATPGGMRICDRRPSGCGASPGDAIAPLGKCSGTGSCRVLAN